MERYTSQQRVEIINIYYRSMESVASTLRALRPLYGRNNLPSRSTIERLVEKFKSTVQNVPVPVRQRSARSVENIAAAEASFEDSPNVSLTRRSQALGISVTCGLSQLIYWKPSLENTVCCVRGRALASHRCP